jgi:hypothetical protein
MDRRSFPQKKLSRLKTVEKSLEYRIEMLSYYFSGNQSVAIQMAKTAKRFRNGKSIDAGNIQEYRTYLREQLLIVRKRIEHLEDYL